MKKDVGKHALAFVLITVLLDIIGFGIILPVMPELITELTGEGLNQAAVYGGWLLFIFALMQFFFAPVIGNLSDAYGRRPVLLLTLSTLVIDYLILGFAPTLAWLFIGRILVGISGATFGVANAFIADISSPEKKAQNFALVGATFGIGFIVGPAIGGLLGEYGPRVPFFVAAGVAAINWVYGYFVLPETLPPEKRRPFHLKRANPLGALKQMKKYPVIIGLMGTVFLFQLAHDSLPSTWTYYTMFKFNWAERDVGLSLALVGLSQAIVQGILIRFAIKRLGEVKTLYLGMVMGIIGYIGFSIATNTFEMLMWIIPWSIMGITMPALRAIMSHKVGADSQGELQGAITSVASFAAILGPLIMTQLFSYFTTEQAPIFFPGASFFLAGILLSIGFFWAVVVISKHGAE